METNEVKVFNKRVKAAMAAIAKLAACEGELEDLRNAAIRKRDLVCDSVIQIRTAEANDVLGQLYVQLRGAYDQGAMVAQRQRDQQIAQLEARILESKRNSWRSVY